MQSRLVSDFWAYVDTEKVVGEGGEGCAVALEIFPLAVAQRHLERRGESVAWR
jgi:hypothetical protein